MDNDVSIKAKKIADEFKSRTSVPCVQLKAERKPVLLTGSKLGGEAYLPKGMECPRDSEGRPLKLLAQLNFGELPKLEHYPQEGLLQFFIRPDDIFGIDFDNMTKQDGFRIIYHKEISDEHTRREVCGCEETDDGMFPFEGEFALSGVLGSCPMTVSYYRFRDEFITLYNQKMNTKETSFLNLDDAFSDTVYDELHVPGHRMGGYPSFTQTDPREYDKSLRKYDTLLFQIDSDGDGEDEIMWGDCGVANFFISLKDLQAGNFTDVIYTWDCG